MAKFLDSTGLTYLWGKITDAINNHYVTAGQKSGTTLGTKATAEGNNTTSSATTSHAEGTDTVASGDYSHAEGFIGFALGQSSHIEGQGTASKNIFVTRTITGDANTKVYSVSEANDFDILGIIKNDDENKCAYIADIDYQNDQITLSAAISTVAFTNKEVSYLSSSATLYDGPMYSRNTGPKVAMGGVSHAEGLTTMALGTASHAEGRITTAIGIGAHSEGAMTTAVGTCSHAEGFLTTANGGSSHVEGFGTIANGDYQHVFGEYNIFDDVKYSRYGIPKGRMRGDINGDGIINETDVDIITKHLANIEIITDAVALWCADADANNEVKANDKSIITKYINKISTVLTSTPTFADYYNNWTYVKVDDLNGYWTYNVTISSGDATNLAGVYANNLVSYSLSGTTLTINVSRPPITDSSILIDVGSGNGSYSEHIEIVGGGKTSVYLSNARTLDWLGNETLAGKLTLGTGPTDNMDATTKQYVDTTIENGNFMVKGIDYVTAGQKSGITLGTKVTAEGYNVSSIGEYTHSEGGEGYAIGAASHIEGQGAAEDNTFSTLTVTGDANTKVYTLSSSSSSPDLYSIVRYGSNYAYIKSIDYENDTITLSAAISTTALTNGSIDYLPSGIDFSTLRVIKYDGPKLTFGIGSHAEGVGTMVIGPAGHAEGYRSTSIGNYSHAEGSSSVAIGSVSHVEGSSNTAHGSSSHVEGRYNVSRGLSQHVFGMWNAADEYSCSSYELPKGRMRGDINGDGKITQEDYTLLNDYISRVTTLDTVGQWCADINNDGSVLSTDAAQLTRYLSGLSNALTGIPTFADYYNNWTYVKVDDLNGYWTCDITITDNVSDILNVKCHNLISYSVSGTTLTVNVSVPPIKDSRVLVIKNSYVSGTVIGENIEIVGNGTASGKEANARTLDWLGNETLAGKLTLGEGPTDDMDAATKQYVDAAIPDVTLFLVTLTESSGTITGDKTYSEISTAAGTGKLCVAVLGDNWYYLSVVASGYARFTKTTRSASDYSIGYVSVSSSNDTWSSGFINVQSEISASGILKGDGSGGVTAAVSGTDYAAASHSHDVATGGTGRSTLTSNAILTGNGTSAVNMVTTASGAAYATAANGALTFGTLPVAQGGTGATTLTSGAALIGSGTGAVTTRTITNNTATSTALTANTNLITQNTLRYHTNRTASAAAAETNYTTYMFRGEALNSSDTNPSVNGAISWTYA